MRGNRVKECWRESGRHQTAQIWLRMAVVCLKQSGGLISPCQSLLNEMKSIHMVGESQYFGIWTLPTQNMIQRQAQLFSLSNYSWIERSCNWWDECDGNVSWMGNSIFTAASSEEEEDTKAIKSRILVQVILWRDSNFALTHQRPLTSDRMTRI